MDILILPDQISYSFAKLAEIHSTAKSKKT